MCSYFCDACKFAGTCGQSTRKQLQRCPWHENGRCTLEGTLDAISAPTYQIDGSETLLSTLHKTIVRYHVCPKCRWKTLGKPGDMKSNPLVPKTSDDPALRAALHANIVVGATIGISDTKAISLEEFQRRLRLILDPDCKLGAFRIPEQVN